MASVQERLQLKRVPLDKWSIGEQLNLASAVACSGDQNWMSVSRNLKMMCGENRPSDWFSQKSCAAQYGKLLENVETPKRKKRNEKDTSQATVETPSELIVRKLTQERISELKKLIAEERQEYLKLKGETLTIQNGLVDENQLREWWEQIELEQKQREKEKQQHAQWLKEREERKRELERALRPNAHLFQASPNQSPTKAPHLNVKVKLEEMEMEDSSSRQGTSPLLTSLLKSPSPAPNPGASILHNVMNLPGNQSRVSAPTITNLLTGSITNLSSSLAAVTQQNITKTITSSSASITTPYPAQIQTQPLTGPPPHEHMTSSILQSPSQAAPTLSLLLENKHKESMQQKMPPLARIEQPPMVKTEQPVQIIEDKIAINTSETTASDHEEANSPMKDEDQQLMEVFNGLIPDNIDELADILTENNAIILNPELLEEESILDNVDDLIDEEDAAAMTTPATTPIPAVSSENNDFQKSVDANVSKNLGEAPPVAMVAEIQPTVDNAIKEKEPHPVAETQFQESVENIQETVEQEKMMEAKLNEPENEKKSTILKDDESSDLSNDTPLAELIKQESEKAKLREVKREEPDAFESDSNDEKSLENIKRGIQAIQDNTSNENSTDPADMKENISLIEEVGEEDASFNRTKDEEVDSETKAIENNPETVEDINSEGVDKKDVIEMDEEKIEVKEEPTLEAKEEEVEDQSAVKEEVELPSKEEKETTDNKDAIVEIKEEKPDDEKKDSIVLIEETDDAQVEESLTETPASAKKDCEIKIDDQSSHSEAFNEATAKIEPERKLSTDEEMFEVAKEHLENTKSEETEQITEPEPCQQTITIIDTDDDSPIEVIKEDKTGRTKRDYSRRKQESGQSIDKRFEETTSSDDVSSSTNTRLKLKERDRDRSESPYIDEESGEPAAKNKRRYSTTPNLDSLPNSPASSDDREYRGWKKSILLVHHGLITHRYASLFAKPITEDQAPKYKEIVLQPMDLQTLKRNIDNGTIRTTLEFTRYVMVMCYNAIFYNFNDEVTCSRAKEMLNDGLALIEDIMDTWKKENEKSSATASTSSSGSATKTVRGRKSNRLMN